MFKILTLEPTVDDKLQVIQKSWMIEAVQNLGTDSAFNHYLLVEYDIALPGTTSPVSSGSNGSGSLSGSNGSGSM